jgi:hypothetical protein
MKFFAEYWLHAHRLPEATPRRLAIIAGIRKKFPVDWEVPLPTHAAGPTFSPNPDPGHSTVIEGDPGIDRLVAQGKILLALR